MSSRFGFLDAVRGVERRLVGALGLGPLSLPTELQRLDGTYRDEPARLEARAYSGGRVRYARFVELTGPALEIGNVACYAHAELDVPLLGIDLVGLGRDTAVVVADLSPLNDDRAARRAQLGVLAAHRSARADAAGRPALEDREPAVLPAWAAAWFSDGALSARVSAGEAAEAAAAVDAFASAFVELAERANPDPGNAARMAAQQAAYGQAHREHDRGLGLLRRIFEPALADRFLREVLFPERLPA